MRLKTAVIIGFLTTVLVLTALLASLNQEILLSPFNLLGWEIKTYWAFALSLMAGFVSFAAWFVATGISQLGDRWLQRIQQRGERHAEEAYLKGLDAVLGGRPLEGISQFQKALEASPAYLPALLKLGDSYRSIGKVTEAVECHQAALQRHSQDLPTLYALLEDYLAQENHQEAKKTIQEILRIQPRRALKALRVLRNLYIQEGNWRKALEIQERIQEARVLEQERAEDSPYTQGILYQIGVDLLEQEKYQDAISQLEKVRKRYPAFVPTYLTLAEGYLLDGREKEAVSTWMDGYRKAGAPECLLAMERMLLQRGSPEEAVRQYQNLVSTTDRKVIPKFLLGRLYYRLEMLEQADALFRDIEGTIKESGLLRFYLGRIRERVGDLEKACAHYRAMIRILNPFELLFACSSCHRESPDWKGYCAPCRKWGTYHPKFRDELMQEIQEVRPYYDYPEFS